MPNLGDSNEQSAAASLLKLLLIGDTKAGKTDWAMRVAEAGFNVLYLDGDVALQTILDRKRGLSPAALSRVNYINCSDYVDAKGNYVPFMAKFFVEFSTSGVLTWNDTKGRLFDRATYERVIDESDPENPKVVGGDVIWQIRPAAIGPDTVLIMDSWTTLVTSIQQWKAADLGIDLLDIEKLERDMYTGTGHKATQFLQLMRALRCHLIVIGHPREYQKRSPPAGSKGQVAERDLKLDWSRMVPMSTSNPHALTMGKNFSDIGWIDVSAMGTRTIDFKASNERVIGGHLNDKKNVDEFSCAQLIEQIGGQIPSSGDTSSWLTRYGPGEFQIAGSASKPLTGSSAATATQVKGLSGFAALKAKGVEKTS